LRTALLPPPKKKGQKPYLEVPASSKNNSDPYLEVPSNRKLAIYIKKYLKENLEELWKLNYISPCKNIIIFKKSSKRNQNPSTYYYYNSITNLKFQHKPKYHHLSKILI
jgi:hypothetical protein